MRPILTLLSLTVSAVLYAPLLGLSDALATEPDPWSGWTCTVDTTDTARTYAPGVLVPADVERIPCEGPRPVPDARSRAVEAAALATLRELRTTGRPAIECAYDAHTGSLLGVWSEPGALDYDDEVTRAACPVVVTVWPMLTPTPRRGISPNARTTCRTDAGLTYLCARVGTVRCVEPANG